MTQPRTHLVVGTPCFGGQVASLYATSLLRLQSACARRGDLDLSFNLLSGDALIPRARQNIVAHFLENPSATHLIFIDADIAFGPEQVFRLLDSGLPMAAGVYPTKRINWDNVAALGKLGGGIPESAALSYVLQFEDPAKLEKKDGFAKARFAGTGFLMIRREALEAMVGKYRDLAYLREHQAEDPLRGSKWRCALFNPLLDASTGTYLSEDYSFCRRWTDMGGEVWVDLKSRLTHIGSMSFAGDLAAYFGPNP
jgi:hypothetical protein